MSFTQANGLKDESANMPAQMTNAAVASGGRSNIQFVSQRHFYPVGDHTL